MQKLTFRMRNKLRSATILKSQLPHQRSNLCSIHKSSYDNEELPIIDFNVFTTIHLYPLRVNQIRHVGIE